ncbi:L-type lectin-domain containing receptor kinase IX.1-like [Senna tora]|uniref:non-specific serine/threonine protein kinase n=1 Tax=Senna tora TaxID=362788 RepID=A0A834XCM8_9FABA|nr:L-type lectin-domain containing receptor kinase IX.1-like [Senna tora]
MEASHHRMKNNLLPSLAITKNILWFLIIIPGAATTITFNYQQFLDKNNYEHNLKLEGDVYQENGFLQLTRNGPDSAGRVTYNKQLQLWDSNTKKLADFNTHFSFIINSSDSNHLGDGITFFLAHPNFPLPKPPDGSGIGLVGRREMSDPNYPQQHPFVAVEFDTFPNKRLGDPPYDHVGIDVKKMWTPYTTQWYNVKDGKKVYDAEITYNSSSHMLNVAFTGYKNDTKIKQEYSHEIDFRDFLPNQVQFDSDFERSIIGPKGFSYKELVKATNNFAEEKKLGEGGFEWKHCVVHRDIKPSNIMLDSNFNAKLGDFGLARLVDHDKGSSETTVIAGTKGYMAPESATVNKATKESDVYSFGVVALEIACGRKPIVYSASEEQVVMVEWVWELYGLEKLPEAADPRLRGDFKEEELERLMIVGLWCAHPDYVLRPTIRQAMNVLNFEASLPILPPKMPKPTYIVPSFSEIGASSSCFNPNNPKSGGSYTGSSEATMSDTSLLPR